MSSRFLAEVYPSLKIILNTTGLTSAFVVVIAMLYLKCYYPAHVNRVSLRLQWAIAFIDVVKHTLIYFVKFDVSPVVCSMIGFLMCFLDQIYFMLNISIVANMQLMFIQNKFPRSSWELKYWAGSLSIATLLTLPPLILGMYGRNKLGQCFISREEKLGEALAFFLVVFMTTTTLLYCILVPCIIIARINLNSAFSHLRNYVNQHRPGFQSHFNRQLKRIIVCSMLYPLACFLSMVGSLVYVYFMFIFTTPSTELFIFALATRSLTGVFNLIAFLMDPSIQRALTIAAQSVAFLCTEARLSSGNKYIISLASNPDAISISSEPLSHNASAVLDEPSINIDEKLQTYLNAM